MLEDHSAAHAHDHWVSSGRDPSVVAAATVIGGLLAGSGASTLRRMVETPDLRVDPQPVRPRSLREAPAKDPRA
jgi:hypothetical protein